MKTKKCNYTQKIITILIDTIDNPKNEEMVDAIGHINECPICQEEFKLLSTVFLEPDQKEIPSMSYEDACKGLEQMKQQMKSKQEPSYSDFSQTVKKHKKNLQPLSDFKNKILSWVSEPFERLVPEPALVKIQPSYPQKKRKGIVQADHSKKDNTTYINKYIGQQHWSLGFKKTNLQHILFILSVTPVDQNDYLQNARIKLINIDNNDGQSKPMTNGKASLEIQDYGMFNLIIKHLSSEIGSYQFKIDVDGIYE